MADFNDYLGDYGNINYCWKIHVRKMKSLDLPYCSYKTFHGRVRRLHRPLYQAIHTPCDIERRKSMESKGWWHRFISLFK